MNLQNGPLDKGLLALIAPLIVLPPWIWMAVHTRHCLQIVTAHTIPITKRTIWLVKTLALIVGVGGLFGAVVQVGISWILAILSGGIIVFFALKESVQEVVPPKPSQDAKRLINYHGKHIAPFVAISCALGSGSVLHS